MIVLVLSGNAIAHTVLHVSQNEIWKELDRLMLHHKAAMEQNRIELSRKASFIIHCAAFKKENF